MEAQLSSGNPIGFLRQERNRGVLLSPASARWDNISNYDFGSNENVTLSTQGKFKNSSTHHGKNNTHII